MDVNTNICSPIDPKKAKKFLKKVLTKYLINDILYIERREEYEKNSI